MLLKDRKEVVWFALLVMVIASWLLPAGCSALGTSSDDEKQTRLVVTGSSTIAPLASEIARRFESLHPGTRIDVQTGGSSRGINDVRQGLAQVGMVSRALDSSENDLHAFTIARDGVCLIVHKSNPVPSLTDSQVAEIFRGEHSSWKDFGGEDRRITVVNKAEGRATLEVFTEYFKLKPSEIREDVVIGDNEQGIKVIAGNPGAIGYVSIGTAEHDAADGVSIRILPLAGVQASAANVASGAFPLSRPLNLISLQPPAGLAREFIEFSQSAAVHDLIYAQDFVPVSK